MKDYGWGTVAIPIGRRRFDCPICGPGSRCRTVRAIAMLFVAWVPVFPYKSRGTYRECRSCLMTFDRRASEPLAHAAILHILEHALGHCTPPKPIDRDGVARIYEELTGEAKSPGDFEATVEPPRALGYRFRKEFRRKFPYMNTRGVMLCLKAVMMQIAENGFFHEWERRFLRDVASGLRISNSATIRFMENIPPDPIPTALMSERIPDQRGRRDPPEIEIVR